MPFLSPVQLRKIRSRQKMLTQEIIMYQRVMVGLRKSLKFDSLLKLIVDSVRKGMGFKRAGIFLVEPDGKKVRLALGVCQFGRYEQHQKRRPLYILSGNDMFSHLVFGEKKYFFTNNYTKHMPNKTWEKNLSSETMRRFLFTLDTTGLRAFWRSITFG